MLVTSHQSVFDERSFHIFDQELAALYEAFHEKRPATLSPLPIQYADFAIWQRERLRNGALEGQISHWKRRLQGAPAVLGLPASRRRPRERTFRGATETVRIGRELTAGIRSLCRREGTTLFMTLLAAFQVLLRRHSGRGDITVGAPVDGRSRSDVEGLIGLFANILVLRTDLSGDPTFREVLARVREVVMQAQANQEVPFERLVEELNPERTLSRPPLFQVMMRLQEAPSAPLRLAGLSVTPLPLTTEVARYDLTLSFADGGGEILASLQYNTDIFGARTIRRMLAHLEVLLQGIVEDPDRPLSQLPLMAAGERQQLLVEWNQTAVEYPNGMTVSRLFEEQAERTPDAMALKFDGEALSYGELNRRSNKLARYLQRMGVGSEVLVGSVCEAVFGHGRGASRDPQSGRRLRTARSDLPRGEAEPHAPGLGRQPGAGRPCGHGEPAAVFRATDRPGGIADADCGGELPEPAGRIDPRQLAYVIYTSGSTGSPKGVEIEHRSLANYTQYAADRFGLRTDDRVLQFASLSFDVAAEEIFTTLSRGAALVLRSEEMIATVTSFLAKCREWNLTVLGLPTAYWHELAAAASAERLPLPESVRLVVIGGEKALPEALAQWREVAGSGVRLLNLYGPTETTVSSTVWEAGRGEPDAGSRTVPIGRPIANTRMYVLDGSLQPVPIGVVGELYIGGDGLARGYRNRPELTAERFLRDPFRGGGERMYRTGDRVRYRPDGDLEYLGRADDQVKLRGFRVELGEVEEALRAHPNVQDAVVALKGAGDQRLVAYLLTGEKQAPEPAELRSFLKRTLPDFMIPVGVCQARRLSR